MTDVEQLFTSEEAHRTKQEDLRQAKEELAGPVPLIAEAPDCSLVLPRGLLYRGAFKTHATVRELTGADEETLAKTREPTDYYDMVVALGTASIDDVDLTGLPVVERTGMLRSLLIGERDQLFLAIVKATFGEDKTLGFTCQTCGEAQEITLLLSEDFKPKDVGDLAEIYNYLTSKGDTLEYRLVTGDDQQEALGRKGASLAEQNTVILSRCITKRNGGLIVDPIGYVRALPIRDRQQLLAELIGKQPSIDLGVTTTCAACGAQQALSLGWGDLFRT